MRPQVFSPGAGHRPLGAALPGRAAIRNGWLEILAQLEVSGRERVRDLVFEGLRGAGKTVLLGELCDLAGARGFEAVRLQSTREQGVWDELAAALDELAEERPDPFWRRSLEALSRIRGISVAGFGVDLQPGDVTSRTGVGRSSRHLARTLADLGTAIRDSRGRGGLVIAVDELQTAPAGDIELLGAALHQLNVLHPLAPVAVVGAGLPSTRDAMVGTDPEHPLITHPERLFRFQEVAAFLDEGAVVLALTEPVQAHEGSWTQEAIDRVREATQGYPAHLQVVAAETWTLAQDPRLDLDDVERALPSAAEEIETQYLAPRWNRLTDRQQEYVTALAVAGGTATSRQLQQLLGRGPKELSRVRDELIRRGEIYAPRSRVVALAMPLMDRYAVASYPQDREASALRDRLRTLDELRAGRPGVPAAGRQSDPLEQAEPDDPAGLLD